MASVSTVIPFAKIEDAFSDFLCDTSRDPTKAHQTPKNHVSHLVPNHISTCKKCKKILEIISAKAQESIARIVHISIAISLKQAQDDKTDAVIKIDRLILESQPEKDRGNILKIVRHIIQTFVRNYQS